MTQNTAFAGQNDFRFDDAIKFVRSLGEQAAQGVDSLPKFGCYVVKCANEGIFDLTKNKHGEGVDDARKIYEAYLEEMSSKAVHDHSAAGKKANSSKVRKLIEFGCGTRYDPVEVLDRTMQQHQEAQANKVKVKAPYAAYVDVARAQIASDSELTDDQIMEAIRKPEGDDKELIDEINAIVKKLGTLIEGKNGLKCQEQPVIDAHDMLREFAGTLALKKKADEQLAKYNELKALIEGSPAEVTEGDDTARGDETGSDQVEHLEAAE
jgi:hypothetical protein